MSVAVVLGTLCLSTVGATTASASLGVFYSDVGQLSLSVDGIGTNESTGTVEVEKPSGATVKKAFLFAASTGETGYIPPDGGVTIDGTPVSWDPSYTLQSSILSWNVAADVTSIVTPKIESAAPGLISFTIGEEESALMDGEILAVVFADPNVREQTITLLYGAQSTSGDSFSVGLSEPMKPSATAILGLGISYGFQPAGQYSIVEVNKQAMTSSAGGQDDCSEKYAAQPDWANCANGSLLTVGGIGDSPDNPPEPFATDDLCVGPLGPAPRCDDELYSLTPFVPADASTLEFSTLNPSNDDNIFFASLDLAASTGVVGPGIVLSPGESRIETGTFQFLTGHVQDGQGKPEAGRQVTLTAISGPNTGSKWESTTDANGDAQFNYASKVLGKDTLQASYLDGQGVLHESNQITEEWTPYIPGTFGGEWPYHGNSLQLYYSYSGGHRYLGNVTQGAENWNHAGTKVHFSPWPGGQVTDDVPFVDVNTSETWWGMTIFANHDCSTCGYTQNSVELNQHTLDPESDAQRTKVATHELGHTLGLEHPGGWTSTSTPSVMWQGLLNGTVKETPQPFDTQRVNGMYP